MSGYIIPLHTFKWNKSTFNVKHLIYVAVEWCGEFLSGKSHFIKWGFTSWRTFLRRDLHDNYIYSNNISMQLFIMVTQ